MKAIPEHLRIGNLVLANGVLATVQTIDQNGIQYDSLDGEKCAEFCEWDKVDSVPLSKDWLLRFGFVGDDNIFEFGSGEKIQLDDGGYTYNVFYSQCNTEGETSLILMSVELDCVDQLQNFLLSMTMKEPKIKDK